MSELVLVRYSERPDLWARTGTVSEEVWPEYNLHGDVLGPNWGRLFDEFPDFQFVLLDPAGSVLAEGHTAPLPWDGRDETLGPGIDAALLAALAGATAGTPSGALCALAAEIRPAHQGRGLADRVLDGMGHLARDAGLTRLIAPVRPSLKERYPITPIGEYVRWTREDGQPFDPWIRVHIRRGGRMGMPLPRSLRISGTVGEWEEWTGLRLPASGTYTFPRGLAPLRIDRGVDQGLYWEPNVWIVHDLGGSPQQVSATGTSAPDSAG